MKILVILWYLILVLISNNLLRIIATVLKLNMRIDEKKISNFWEKLVKTMGLLNLCYELYLNNF